MLTAPLPHTSHRIATSAELAAAIARADRSRSAATVVGFGRMGRQYVAALQALGVGRLRVCSRSPQPLEALQGAKGVESLAGGFERLSCTPQPEELGIVATPTPSATAAAARLATLGFRRLLIEKPVALSVGEVERLADTLAQAGVEAFCAYNRVAYPSCQEVRARVAQEGGITSCTYTFTEMIQPDWPQRFAAEELARWGIANSLHVMSLAHGLIGWPTQWAGHRAGHLAWHEAGTVFVGSGVSERGIPFSYHADWGSTGRWSVEVHTAVSSYRFCPLEGVARRQSATADWKPVPVETFAPAVKVGFVEQVAAMLDPAVRQIVPLVSLREAAALMRFGSDVFGYERP